MAVYSFADINVEVKNRYMYFDRQSNGYAANCTEPDLTVVVTDDDIKNEQKVNPNATNLGYIEAICAYRNIVKSIAPFDAFMLHSAVFTVGDRCLAFLAHSGVGKTTHMKLWMELLGDRLTVINGDKPIIRFLDGQPFAYSTPFNGKENIGTKSRALLTDLCFIERCETNSVEKKTPLFALDRIINQIIMPQNSEDVYKTLGLIDSLINCCDIWLIKCNMQCEAAQTSYNAIINSER